VKQKAPDEFGWKILRCAWPKMERAAQAQKKQ